MSIPIRAGRNKWFMECLVPRCGLKVPVEFKVCDAHRNGPYMLLVLQEVRDRLDKVISMVKTGQV